MRNGVARCQTHQCGDVLSACHVLPLSGTRCLVYTVPAFLLLSLLHSYVLKCGVDIVCSLKLPPKRWGILSRLYFHPLSGHAFSSTCPAQHPIPHELPTSTSAPANAVLGTLCFHVDHSDSWVPFVEIRNGPYSFLNPSAVFILRGLRTYTREWMTCEVK